jgi:hypothetical protein
MTQTALRIALQSQGIPVVGISGTEPPYNVCYDESATPEQIEAGNAIALSYTEPPEPNREAFRIGIVSDPGVLRVLNSNPIVSAVLINTLNDALNGNVSLLSSVKTLWDAMVSGVDPLTAEDIDRINAIASSNNIPGFSLSADGTISIE